MMYQVDLHLKNETTVSAVYNLKESIRLARRSKERAICFIVGYGSTGGTHKIRTAVLEELEQLYASHQIKGYILGSEMDIFNVKYQNLKGKEYIDKEAMKRKNPGEVIVIL